MIARIHYDDEMLTRLLQDRLAEDEHQVNEHVEACEQCQNQLETITLNGLTWEEAGDMLRDDLLDQASETAADPSGRSFLQATDHPESLGRIGRYEIMEILGGGGMGIVMRGFDPALNRHSAIKALAPELASSAAARQRFSREAKSAAAVVHPHVVPIQNVDQQNGIPYLVMPVVEGESLQQRVQRDGPLDVIEVVRIAAQVAEGLAAAHAQGLVHRDIKPANILLEHGIERVQITDFGLARAADDASMTRSGVIAGTPQYMSPEQAHGDSIDPRSDLFSVGSLMYFMCTGRSPFRAETTMGVLNRIVNDNPRSIQSINTKIPDWLQNIIERLLEKSPDNRPATASDLAEELNGWLAHLQTPNHVAEPATSNVRSKRRRPPTRKPWFVFAAAMGLSILTAVIVLESSKGTIQIENNSDFDVPIRIRRGQQTVEDLTVNANGASTRVRAGEYIIEILGNADGFEISGDRVTLTRGENWVAKVTHRVQNAAITKHDFPTSDPSHDLSSQPSATSRTSGVAWVSPAEYRETLKAAQKRVDQVTEHIQRWRERLNQWIQRENGHGDGKPIANSNSSEEARESLKNQELLLLVVQRDQRFLENQLTSQIALLSDERDTAGELAKLVRTQQELSQTQYEQGLTGPSELVDAKAAVLKAAAELRRATSVLESYQTVAKEFGLTDPPHGDAAGAGGSFDSSVSVLIGVESSGKIDWQGRTVTVEELCANVAKLKMIPERTIIQLNAHPSVSYQKINQLLDALRKVPQLDGINVVVQSEPQAGQTSAEGSPASSAANDAGQADTADSKDLEIATWEWDQWLDQLPLRETVLVMIDDNSDTSRRMRPLAEQVTKAAGMPLSVFSVDGMKFLAARGTHFLLIKHRQLIDTLSGLQTTSSLQRFITGAVDYLTPTQAHVDPRSLVRIDCFINPGPDKIGLQAGGVHTLTGAVVAQHEDRALVIASDHIVDYVNQGYACLIVEADASGTVQHYPFDIIHDGQVVIRENQYFLECGTAVFLVEGALSLRPAPLASTDWETQAGEAILTGGFASPRRRGPIRFDTAINWQSQTVRSSDALQFRSSNGPQLIEVEYPWVPAPVGVSFNSDGELIGRYALGDSSDQKEKKYSILPPTAMHAVLEACLPQLDDQALADALKQAMTRTSAPE